MNAKYKKKIYFFCIAFALLMFFSACSKKTEQIIPPDSSNNSSSIKVEPIVDTTNASTIVSAAISNTLESTLPLYSQLKDAYSKCVTDGYSAKLKYTANNFLNVDMTSSVSISHNAETGTLISKNTTYNGEEFSYEMFTDNDLVTFNSPQLTSFTFGVNLSKLNISESSSVLSLLRSSAFDFGYFNEAYQKVLSCFLKYSTVKEESVDNGTIYTFKIDKESLVPFFKEISSLIEKDIAVQNTFIVLANKSNIVPSEIFKDGDSTVLNFTSLINETISDLNSDTYIELKASVNENELGYIEFTYKDKLPIILKTDFNENKIKIYFEKNSKSMLTKASDKYEIEIKSDCSKNGTHRIQCDVNHTEILNGQEKISAQTYMFEYDKTTGNISYSDIYPYVVYSGKITLNEDGLNIATDKIDYSSEVTTEEVKEFVTSFGCFDLEIKFGAPDVSVPNYTNLSAYNKSDLIKKIDTAIEPIVEFLSSDIGFHTASRIYPYMFLKISEDTPEERLEMIYELFYNFVDQFDLDDNYFDDEYYLTNEIIARIASKSKLIKNASYVIDLSAINFDDPYENHDMSDWNSRYRIITFKDYIATVTN